MSKYIDSAAAAEILGVSQDTVRTLFRSGRLRGFKPSNAAQGEWRTTTEDIDAFMERSENRPPERQRRRQRTAS